MAAKECGATVWGQDINPCVEHMARSTGAIDEVVGDSMLGQCDFLLIALYPDDARQYLRRVAKHLLPGCTVVDCCGVKSAICQLGDELAKKYGFVFIGGHPMAGSEKSGFEAARADLFLGASMILTPAEQTDKHLLQQTEQLFLNLGFGQITYTTPEQHDKIIAFTSQMPHVLANAYIKSPTAGQHKGFTGGSYQDMSRVAYLNEEMWSRLFMENSQPLLEEIDGIIFALQQYKNAIVNRDRDTLRQLLRDGRIKKQQAEE